MIVQSFDHTTIVPDGAQWYQLAVIPLGGIAKSMLLEVINSGANALAHFKVSRTALQSGHANNLQVDILADTDLNTASVEMIDCVTGNNPANLYQLAAAGHGQVKFDKLEGVQEIGLWAKTGGSATTIRIAGLFVAG